MSTGGLASFSPDARVAVIGASGGIGSAFCQLLDSDPAVAKVYRFSRTTPGWRIDIEDENSIAAAAESLGEMPLDLVLVATGILHHERGLQPEKRLEDLNRESLARLLAINTIGPALVAKHFLPRLRRNGKTVFAALSARVGSIADNRLGGWTSYRASKAALNQVIRTLAIEQTRLRPESILAALHPGTVDTRLSRPFTSRTPAQKLFSPLQAATYLLDVVDGLSAEHTGGFFAWDASPIEF